ncbi:CLUMA_CG016340, isoform A [Clunio marinus]|uniref:CLUMA_CG016340, isoform A n=1 Tax=Clunio marinus TaxID=568069 RepID=A0A1J1IU23_9DIPT|nr:CLUMA_CG016340, isoform A [Clunio marinus]
MRKVSESDLETTNYDEYENSDDNDDNKKIYSGTSHFEATEHSNTFNNNTNPQINQHYNSKTGGNDYNPQQNDQRDANPYQYTYNDNNKLNIRNHNDGHRNDSNNKQERDKACVLQCFFQELKMSNDEGFPDKHKALHVLTRDLRDRELKDFYTDSIQECFRMIDTDPKLHRDNCLFSKALIICMTERAKMNCSDWQNSIGEGVFI